MNDDPHILGFADGRSAEIVDPLSEVENADVLTTSNREGYSKFGRLVHAGIEQINNNRPDVLLSNHPGRLGAAVLALGRMKSVPVVIRIAGDMWKTNYEEFQQDLIDRNLLSALARTGQIGLNSVFGANADGYFVVSDELRRLVINRTGCPPKQVRQVPVPIDSELYRAGNSTIGREHVDQNPEHILLTVTNLRFRGKIEGVRHLIQEIIPLLEENSEITYVIAGGGRYLDDLRRYAEQTVPEAIRDQIVVAGFVSDIQDLYAAADVFVYCSYIDGYPNVVSEAMVSGLPVVANADHGMVEQIVHGETGLLVDSDERGAFTRATARLVSDDALATQLGTNAQQCVSTRNDPDRIGREMADAISEILRAI